MPGDCNFQFIYCCILIFTEEIISYFKDISITGATDKRISSYLSKTGATNLFGETLNELMRSRGGKNLLNSNGIRESREKHVL